METLGRYQILGELGRGGCGVVYRALDPRINRKVAIKTVQPNTDSTLSSSLRERFRREAQSAGGLSHPNIVTVHEFDDTGEMTYIVMEYVEGQTLAQKMAGGQPLPLEFILSVVASAGAALDFAHAQNIVHRDVKPANFLITPSGFLKIADFGIAKVMNAEIGLTSTGMVVGTAHYMSPEQVAAKPVTGRSDQFSLGVIAYEMLTGKKPFEGDSWASVLHQIMSVDPPPVKQFRESLGDSVTMVLRRALAKDAADRYPSCSQFAAELSEAVIGTTIERTMIQPISQAMKGPLPPPSREQLPPTQLLPSTRPLPQGPAQTAERSIPPARSRSGMVPIAAGGILAALIFGAWLMFHSRSAKPDAASAAAAASSSTASVAPPVTAPPVTATATANTEKASEKTARATNAAEKKIPQSAVESSRVSPAVPAPTPVPAATSAAAPTIVAQAPPSVAPPAGAAPAPVGQTPQQEARPPQPDPRALEAEAWDRVRSSNDIAVLDRFRASYPNGAFSGDAARRIEQIEWERASAANDTKAYRDFVAKYPGGQFSDRARAELAKLDKAGQTAANRRLVDSALARYRQAFENRDLDSLKSVWPGLSRSELSSIQNFFRIARSISLQLRLTGDPEINGDTAVVRSRRVMSASDERGPLPAQDQMVTIHLRKSGDAMVIDSVQADGR